MGEVLGNPGESSRPGGQVRIPLMRLPGNEDLSLPAYASAGAAGADLPAAVKEPLTVRMGEIHLVPTGFALAIPPGFEGQVRPRSGLALRAGLSLVNSPGTVDSDYRGEIKLVVTCASSVPCVIRRGDRIAQIVFSPVARAEFQAQAALEETARGPGGFGHTGVRSLAGETEPVADQGLGS